MSRLFWVLICHLLLLLAPKGGPGVSKLYGAFTTLQAGRRIHVNASGTELPKDGTTCERGLLTISQGLARARAGDIVEVCDSSTYGENISVPDQVSLISLKSQVLGAGFTVFDVILKCGETPDPFPTISGVNAGQPVVSIRGVKGVTVRGFNITGGQNPDHGGGVMIANAREVTIVANCIEHNRAEAGGGVGISAGSRGVVLDRNAIHHNIATDEEGGGIWIHESMRIKTTGNAIGFNEAMAADHGSGGGLASKDSGDEEHTDDQIFNNTCFNWGGGAHHEDATGQATYDNCQFLANEAREEGGGGINVNEAERPFIIRNSLILSNLAGFAADMGPIDRFHVEQGGGGIRVHGGDIEIRNCEFTGNRTALDGGGLMISPVADMPLFPTEDADEIEFPSSGTLEDLQFNDNVAEDDGGGFSNQVKATTVATRIRFQGNQAVSNGGAFHTSCSAIITFSQVTAAHNTAQNDDGGGLYNRDGQVTVASTEPGSVIEHNQAGRNGGGMYFGTSPNPAGGIFNEMTVCSDNAPLSRLRGVVFRENRAGNFGGGLSIFFRDPGDERSINFIVEEGEFRDNLGKDTAEGAVDVRFHQPPPKGQRRSNLTACRFANRGVQIKSSTLSGITVDFYDIADCRFDLPLEVVVGARRPVGIELFADSPRVKGRNTRIVGDPLFPEAFGIFAKRSTQLEIEDAALEGLAVGISNDRDAADRVGLTLRNVVLANMGETCVQLTGGTLDTKGSTFSLAPFGIRLFQQSTIEREARLLVENMFQAVVVPVSKTGN
ncbi:MAG TPA: right-handed parallel beta-helix repeat-containing protein [Planctomycetota bacterium]|nr:right-handed parallel beta-helix repeat-containing protein [Planctomycetota bacterium]